MSAQSLPFKDSSACRDGVILTGGNEGRIIQVKVLPTIPMCQVQRCAKFYGVWHFFGSGKCS